MSDESGLLVLDLSRRELRARGVSVPIGGRAFEILAILAQSAGELVLKDELMRGVWPGAIVEENTLQAHIAAIRKALGADRDSLKTVSGRGYRLVGNWTPRAATGSAQPPSPEPSSVATQGSRTNLPVADSGDSVEVGKVEPCWYRAVTKLGDIFRIEVEGVDIAKINRSAFFQESQSDGATYSAGGACH